MVLPILNQASIYLGSLRAQSATAVKTPRPLASRRILANHHSTWFNQDE
jgi:hypothetical protein